LFEIVKKIKEMHLTNLIARKLPLPAEKTFERESKDIGDIGDISSNDSDDDHWWYIGE